MSSYSSRCPAVKRLLKEANELHEPSDEYFAQPLEDNLFEWHFTIRGPLNSDFHGGLYHGRIIMPPEYPMKPPNIIFLTANGRFETNTKICLSISGHHPETWQPSWSIRTALVALISFLPTPAHGTIGGLDYTPAERVLLARKSVAFKCSECGSIRYILKPTSNTKSFHSDTLVSEKVQECKLNVTENGYSNEVDEEISLDFMRNEIIINENVHITTKPSSVHSTDAAVLSAVPDSNAIFEFQAENTTRHASTQQTENSTTVPLKQTGNSNTEHVFLQSTSPPKDPTIGNVSSQSTVAPTNSTTIHSLQSSICSTSHYKHSSTHAHNTETFTHIPNSNTRNNSQEEPVNTRRESDSNAETESNSQAGRLNAPRQSNSNTEARSNSQGHLNTPRQSLMSDFMLVAAVILLFGLIIRRVLMMETSEVMEEPNLLVPIN